MDQTAQLLKDRALALARRPTPAVDRSTQRFLTFALGGETYALAAEFVVSVMRLKHLTPLPGAIAPVSGITPHRGGILTLLDLRPILGVAATSLADRGRVVVVGMDGTPLMGLLADAVYDVQSLDVTGLAPVDVNRAANGLVVGLTSDATVVLDAQRLIELQDDSMDTYDHHPKPRHP